MLAPVTHIHPVTVVERERLLPVPGEVLVRVGQKVRVTEPIARANIAPRYRMVDVAKSFDIPNDQATKHILVESGMSVKEGDELASRKGLTTRYVRSPIEGEITLIIGHQILIKEKSTPFELLAGLPGTVSNLTPNLGATITASGALIQGIWGNHKLQFGLMNVLADTPMHLFSPDQIDVSMRGSVILAGHVEQSETLMYARDQRLRGMILASMASSLVSVAMQMPFPIVILEGLGQYPMNDAAFRLLSSNDKREITVNAQPLDRSTNQRPELFIPLPADNALNIPPNLSVIEPGTRVRIIRDPYHGEIGFIKAILPTLYTFPSGIKAKAVSISLRNKDTVIVPLKNVDVLA